MQRISNVKCLGLLVWFCMFLYSVCVLLLSWKPLVTRNLEFIKIIIFKWLNSGAFGIKLITAHVKYMVTQSYIPGCFGARWHPLNAPVFMHINTSVSTHDVSQCKQGLQWTLGQWLSTSPVSLATVCWSECDWGCGVVWRDAHRSGSWRAGSPGL